MWLGFTARKSYQQLEARVHVLFEPVVRVLDDQIVVKPDQPVRELKVIPVVWWLVDGE